MEKKQYDRGGYCRCAAWLQVSFAGGDPFSGGMVSGVQASSSYCEAGETFSDQKERDWNCGSDTSSGAFLSGGFLDSGGAFRSAGKGVVIRSDDEGGRRPLSGRVL